MKKKMLMIAVASLMMLSACGGNEVTPASSMPTTENSSSNSLKEFEGLSFADQNVVYDGAKHSLSVSNLPEGANVTYSGQDYVNAGTYPITAVVKKTGYVDKTLKATLTIAEADLIDVAGFDASVDQDDRVALRQSRGVVVKGIEQRVAAREASDLPGLLEPRHAELRAPPAEFDGAGVEDVENRAL